MAAEQAAALGRAGAGGGARRAVAACRAAVVLAAGAECCSWRCLCTRDERFCCFEESTWALLFALEAFALNALGRAPTRPRPAAAAAAAAADDGRRALRARARARARAAAAFLALCVVGQLLQVALYAARFADEVDDGAGSLDDAAADDDAGKRATMGRGFAKLSECARVSRRASVWQYDFAWMIPYFSACAWSSVWCFRATARRRARARARGSGEPGAHGSSKLSGEHEHDERGQPRPRPSSGGGRPGRRRRRARCSCSRRGV